MSSRLIVPWFSVLYVSLFFFPAPAQGERETASVRDFTPLELPSNLMPSVESDDLLGNWGGLRNQLRERGLDLAVIYKGEVVNGMAGGGERATVYEGNLDLRASIDGDKVIGVRGLSFFLYGLGNHGADHDGPPGRFTRAAQLTSNIETANDSFRLYEAYAQQTWADQKVSLLVGLHDLSSEFYTTSSASVFLNNSFGVGAELAQTGLNGPSIFPVTAPAARLRIEPVSDVYLQAAVFNALAGDPDHPHGTVVRMSQEDGHLLIAEAGLVTADPRYAKIALGAWSYTTPFESIANGGEKAVSHGHYVIGEAQVSGRLAAFLRAGVAATEADALSSNVSAGFNLSGAFLGRERDRLGLAWTRVTFGSPFREAQAAADVRIGHDENVYEVTYRLELGRGVAVQPDYQYVRNPGGDTGLPDGHVATMRFEVAF